MKYASRFLYYYLLYYCIAAPIFEDKSVVKKFEPWFHCQTFHLKFFVQNHKCPWDFYMWSILPSLQVVANKDGCIWPKAISPDKYYFFSSEQILQREQNPFLLHFMVKYSNISWSEPIFPPQVMIIVQKKDKIMKKR